MDLIIDDIKSQLIHYPESKLIVTGLDRSGKSTFLDNFCEFRRYKDNYGVPTKWSDLHWQFKVFDRHPVIETYVNTKGQWVGDDERLLRYTVKCLKDLENSIFMFFLYPRFRNMRLDDEGDISNFDELYTERYHKVAMAILDAVPGSIVIERLPNMIRRYQNDK